MIRTMVAFLGAVVIVGAAVPATAGDCKGCNKLAKRGEGFCCGKGKAYGVDLTSEKLFRALAGTPIHADRVKCPGCKEAVETSGRCDHCNVGIAHGKAYKSNVSYQLAKGTPIKPDQAPKCSGCKKAHESNGRCSECKVSFVGGRMFKNDDDYKAALISYKMLTAAATEAESCETCAVAMVTDGECDHCKVKFRDGKKSKG